MATFDFDVDGVKGSLVTGVESVVLRYGSALVTGKAGLLTVLNEGEEVIPEPDFNKLQPCRSGNLIVDTLNCNFLNKRLSSAGLNHLSALEGRDSQGETSYGFVKNRTYRELSPTVRLWILKFYNGCLSRAPNLIRDVIGNHYIAYNWYGINPRRRDRAEIDSLLSEISGELGFCNPPRRTKGWMDSSCVDAVRCDVGGVAILTSWTYGIDFVRDAELHTVQRDFIRELKQRHGVE